jgi:RNA polymerase sigma-70 factor (ECF subfamily)
VDFTTVFDRVYPALFRYCHRLTGDADAADDVAQEAFVRLFERDVRGDPRAIRVWLFKVATHLIRDRVRTRENRRRLLLQHPVTPSTEPSPDVATERDETVREVRAALDDLDPRDRQMLLMRQEGFSYREVAEAVGVAHTSVGTLLARAQRRFAERYHSTKEVHDPP